MTRPTLVACVAAGLLAFTAAPTPAEASPCFASNERGMGGTGIASDERGMGGTGIASDERGMGGTGIFGNPPSRLEKKKKN